jgi:hypothetical protein
MKNKNKEVVSSINSVLKDGIEKKNILKRIQSKIKKLKE